LPHVKGAISPLERKDKDLLISAGLGAMRGLGDASALPNARVSHNKNIGQGLNGGGQGGSLERNPSVLSRKELIKQEYNLLLETRLPKIMQLMNSEKSLGFGIGYGTQNQEGSAEAQETPEIIHKHYGEDPKLNINVGKSQLLK